MALSNAERQKRYREKLKAQARRSSGDDALRTLEALRTLFVRLVHEEVDTYLDADWDPAFLQRAKDALDALLSLEAVQKEISSTVERFVQDQLRELRRLEERATRKASRTQRQRKSTSVT